MKYFCYCISGSLLKRIRQKVLSCLHLGGFFCIFPAPPPKLGVAGRPKRSYSSNEVQLPEPCVSVHTSEHIHPNTLHPYLLYSEALFHQLLLSKPLQRSKVHAKLHTTGLHPSLQKHFFLLQVCLQQAFTTCQQPR